MIDGSVCVMKNNDPETGEERILIPILRCFCISAMSLSSHSSVS